MDKLRFVKQSSGHGLSFGTFLIYTNCVAFDTLYVNYAGTSGRRQGKITSWRKSDTPGGTLFYNNFKLELVYG
jgi:hypothetical protein